MGIIADKIRQAIYGKDVRDSIADGIAEVETLRADYDQQVINAGNSNAEIVAARGGEASLPVKIGKIDSSLSDKANLYDLNIANSNIESKASLNYVDTKIGNLGSVKTFKGSCLFSALPVSGMSVDDYWYVTDQTTNYCYNGISWVDIGNNLKIGDNTIEVNHLSSNVSNQIGYPIANMVVNSGFENGVVSWSQSGSTISATDGVATMLATVANGSIIATNLNRIINHKYYIFAKFKSTSKLVGITSVGSIIPGTTHSGSGSYERISTILTAGPSTSAWQLSIKDTRTSGWDNILIDYLGCIDLTATYGIGLEPTIAKMETLLSKFSNSYFSGGLISPYSMKEIKDEIDVIDIELNSLSNAFPYNPIPLTGTSIANASYDIATGNSVVGANWNTIKCECTPNTKYFIDSNVYGGSTALVYYYDNSDVLLGYEVRGTTTATQYTNHEITTPINCYKIASTSYASVPIIKAGTDIQIVKDIIQVQKDIQDVSQSSKLNGKTLMSLGTSITMGNENNYVSYATIISDLYDMTYLRYAFGGSAFATGTGYTSICDKVDTAISAGVVPDIIILEGGTNDIAFNVEIGTISANNVFTTATLDKATFSGAMEYCICKLKTTYVGKKMVFVRVHNMSSRDLTKQQTFGERAKEICEKWGIPIVDLYKNGNLNTNIVGYSSAYTINNDATHPTTEAYNLFYVPLVTSKLLEIV